MMIAWINDGKWKMFATRHKFNALERMWIFLGQYLWKSLNISLEFIKDLTFSIFMNEKVFKVEAILNFVLHVPEICWRLCDCWVFLELIYRVLLITSQSLFEKNPKITFKWFSKKWSHKWIVKIIYLNLIKLI